MLNGEKRYITNGAIAGLLTVMARTPVEGSDATAVTAFVVTPDMPGFEVVEARMEKLGVRGSATARLAFHDMFVPRENILGPPGKGLKVALTVLDFGRTTFGACCTGAAKTSLRLATEHARTRQQFGRTLAEFELVQKKLAHIAASTYAMEAMTTVTAGLIDRGLDDYMLETAMLKVWSTERLWTIVNDAFQIHGGAAYFTDRPLERMLRDHRINQIGEGANEVLMSFMALVGMRGPGLRMKEVADAVKQPWSARGVLGRFLSGFGQHAIQCSAGARSIGGIEARGSPAGKVDPAAWAWPFNRHWLATGKKSSSGNLCRSGLPGWRWSCSPRRVLSADGTTNWLATSGGTTRSPGFSLRIHCAGLKQVCGTCGRTTIVCCAGQRKRSDNVF